MCMESYHKSSVDKFLRATNGTLLPPMDQKGNFFGVMTDFVGHGTSAAASISSKGITKYDIYNNTKKYTLPGVAPNAQIIPVKALWFGDTVYGWLWAAGLALGASLENTVAIGDDRIINREGLRYADEFVRHKALDAVGDLALAGAPILGAYRSRRGGHRLNSLVLKALFADAEAWTLVEAPRPTREVRHAELSQLAVANFAAERS